MDDAEVEWRAHTTQICHIEANAEKHRQEVLTTTNVIENTIQQNNVIFSKKWEATHDRIDRRSEHICLLRNRVVDLEALSGLQQTILQSYQNTIAGPEGTIAKLTASVTSLEKLVCCCRDHLLSPAPHFTSGEEEEMVKETEEEGEEEEEEEDGLEYVTDTPSGGSYTTLPSTGGRSSSPPALSSDTIFARIFRPFSTQLHFTFLNPPFSLMSIFVMFIPLCLSCSRTDDKNAI